MGKYFIFLFLIVVSCSLPEAEKKDVEKILIAKNIEAVNATALSIGYTKYMLAFNDGDSFRTSFGVYSCLTVGDTVIFVRYEMGDSVWFDMKNPCR